MKARYLVLCLLCSNIYAEIVYNIEDTLFYLKGSINTIAQKEESLKIQNTVDYINPFAGFMDKRLANRNIVIEVDKTIPDYARSREKLEKYAVDDLKMVGTIFKRKRLYALVKAPNDRVFVVANNNYLGRCSGKILTISEKSIKLSEWIKVEGRWTKAVRTIYLRG